LAKKKKEVIRLAKKRREEIRLEKKEREGTRLEKKEKSIFSNVLIFIWMMVGILMIALLIEGWSLLITVKKYFP
jgi:hypothetical protein